MTRPDILEGDVVYAFAVSYMEDEDRPPATGGSSAQGEPELGSLLRPVHGEGPDQSGSDRPDGSSPLRIASMMSRARVVSFRMRIM